VQAILLDLDGTLVQSEKLKDLSYAIAVQRLRSLDAPDQRAVEAAGNVGELYLADISALPDLYIRPSIGIRVRSPFANEDIVRLVWLCACLRYGSGLRVVLGAWMCRVACAWHREESAENPGSPAGGRRGIPLLPKRIAGGRVGQQHDYR